MAFPDTDLEIQILAYMGADPTDDSSNWPTATDLSSRLLETPMRITRGRNAGQDSLSSGSCQFDLNNSDGALTPLQASSDYYGQWDLGTPVAVNVAGVGASPPYGRFRGYVADISQTIIPGPGGTSISAVRVTLGGKMRQLTQGSVKKSAMRRFYENVSPQPVAWWPLESGDARAATRFPSGLSGGGSLRVAQSTLFGATRPFSAAGGITPGPPGAASATDTSAGGFLLGSIPLVTSATTARAEASILANGFEDTFPILLRMRNELINSGGTFTSYIGVAAQQFDGVWQVGVIWFGPNGSEDDYTTGGFLLQDNEWHLVQLDASSSGAGADTDYVLRIDGETMLSGTASAFTWSPMTTVEVNSLAVDVDRVAHTAVWSGTSLPTASDSYDAFLGHAGEAAHTRFARICTEDGLPYSTSATSSLAAGPQPVGSAIDILQDIETGDHGMLYELADDWGFGYIASRDRYNLTAALTIDLSTYRTGDDVSSVLTPVRNDRSMRNEWTLSTPDGRTATAKDTAHQAKHGRYDDSASVNLYSTGDLDGLTSWLVHEGTVDVLRYRGMPLDLGANNGGSDGSDDLLSAWLETELGGRIDRTNAPTPEHPDGDTSLILEGYAETLTRRSWRADPVVEPYDPWDVGAYQDTTASGDVPRYDTEFTANTTGLYLPDVASVHASTPDAAALDITGDIDIRFDGRLLSWASGSEQVLVDKYNTTGNQRSYSLRLDATGHLLFRWSEDGTTGLSATSTAAVSANAGDRLAVRVAMDVDNGSGQRVVVFYTAPTIDDTFTQLGTSVTGAVTSIFAGTAVLTVGEQGAGGLRAPGLAIAAEVRSGIAGTVVANPRFADQATDTTSFTDGAGRTWTVAAGANIYGAFTSGTSTKMLVRTPGGVLWTTSPPGGFPILIRVVGAELSVSNITGTTLFQAFTISTTVSNGVAKAIPPGSSIHVATPGYYAL